MQCQCPILPAEALLEFDLLFREALINVRKTPVQPGLLLGKARIKNRLKVILGQNVFRKM